MITLGIRKVNDVLVVVKEVLIDWEWYLQVLFKPGLAESKIIMDQFKFFGEVLGGGKKMSLVKHEKHANNGRTEYLFTQTHHMMNDFVIYVTKPIPTPNVVHFGYFYISVWSFDNFQWQSWRDSENPCIFSPNCNRMLCLKSPTLCGWKLRREGVVLDQAKLFNLEILINILISTFLHFQTTHWDNDM